MNLIDANVLLYAYNSDSELHKPAKRWLEKALSGPTTVAFSWVVLHSLGLDKYPNRPRSPAPPEADDIADNDSLFHDDINQVPVKWDDSAAA